MYYNVVVTIEKQMEKVDGKLIKGRFSTFEEAEQYIEDNGICESDYDYMCEDIDEFPLIEIDEYFDDGEYNDTVTIY